MIGITSGQTFCNLCFLLPSTALKETAHDFDPIHEQFCACDGDAIFLKIVVLPACGGGYTWRQILTKSVILSQKIQLIEFLAIFFCVFFSCRVTCARVAAGAIFAARWQRDNFKKKSHHDCKQKIAFSRGFRHRYIRFICRCFALYSRTVQWAMLVITALLCVVGGLFS